MRQASKAVFRMPSSTRQLVCEFSSATTSSRPLGPEKSKLQALKVVQLLSSVCLKAFRAFLSGKTLRQMMRF